MRNILTTVCCTCIFIETAYESMDNIDFKYKTKTQLNVAYFCPSRP